MHYKLNLDTGFYLQSVVIVVDRLTNQPIQIPPLSFEQE